MYFDRYTDMVVGAGELIGQVGRWPNELKKDVEIPADVEKVYGINLQT